VQSQLQVTVQSQLQATVQSQLQVTVWSQLQVTLLHSHLQLTLQTNGFPQMTSSTSSVQ
jgi:hypothetical protein